MKGEEGFVTEKYEKFIKKHGYMTYCNSTTSSATVLIMEEGEEIAKDK